MNAIRRGLEKAGYAADRVESAEQATTALEAEAFDLAVVDIGLPGADGLALLQRMRRGGVALPVLILTARDGLADRVSALDLGADEQMLDPGPREDVPVFTSVYRARAAMLAAKRQSTADASFEFGLRAMLTGFRAEFESLRGDGADA